MDGLRMRVLLAIFLLISSVQSGLHSAGAHGFAPLGGTSASRFNGLPNQNYVISSSTGTLAAASSTVSASNPDAHGTTAAASWALRARQKSTSPDGRKLLQIKNHAGDSMLPVLPDGYGPWSPRFTNTIAFCAIIRDENVTDIREWLQYHKWLGVDHIYLTENNSVQPIRDALRDYIASGFVTYDWEDTPHAQMLVYQRCLGQYRSLYNWMAFIDADEYLVVRDRNVSLKQFLDRYKHFPGLAVHWVMFGSNGHISRPERGGVMRHYTRCRPTGHEMIKMIANTFFIQSAAKNPHCVFFRGRAAPVNADRYPIPYHPMSRMCTTTSCSAHPGHRQPNSELVTIEGIALFHYVTKSLEDFRIKSNRGPGGAAPGKKMPFFNAVNERQEDADVCQELAQIADACCPEDSVAQAS